MAELESVIEKRLIEQLCGGDSQWTYRPDIRTEEQLWSNFKYILEQNNKAKLDDQPLSESEFAKIKNDLSHASFYDAAKWMVGENGKVYVHVQRGNEVLHLVVLNNEHIAGGSSVYEVVNQYQAFRQDEEEKGRDRRFDVTLLINGIPMIHIELKNKDHSYMDGFRQIKKYIEEDKFHGIFSNVQMFVISNVVDTKYFAAARDTELNKKFLTGWINKDNESVCDYLDFAKAVLRIPETHEMVTKYTVLDNDKKKLLILRPYQIHAIQAMRAASKQGKSGFIWHTTGSGKTMTSYKATRNLLMDIPSIEKTVFLIDRKDLDLQTKRDLERFFANSLWYGFTGTPIFEENKYEQKGDLPQTTKQLYGECLHSYTIKEAIHDEAVLGFMVENLGPKGLSAEEEAKAYESEAHMRSVLDVVLNHSYAKFGMQNVRGKSYEAILTVNSIARAQQYYDLLKRVKNGEDELKISEEIRQAAPDFPKFAITYSLSENEEASKVNQNKMQESMDDYNEMFGTTYRLEGIQAYNGNLNDRLARKEKKYTDRDQQLDLVIVVDRLLTGFDAPCLSTLFMDRQPMTPQNIIQAFSRTNRLYDSMKQYGQIVTFQSPKEFKDAINDALKLYSRGGDGNPIAEDWETVRKNFVISLKALRDLVRNPEEIANLSRQQKKAFIHLFRDLDRDFAHLKAFSSFEPELLDQWEFSEEEYENFAAMYKNVVEELKNVNEDLESDEEPIRDDYDLVAYSKLRIDFEYIVELLQGFVEIIHPEDPAFDEAEFEKKVRELRAIITDFEVDRPKLGALLLQVLNEIEKERERFIGQDISVTINQMRYRAIDMELQKYADRWFLDFEDVRYEAYNYKDGELANENKLKDSADYAAYREATPDALPKFKFRKAMIEEFREMMRTEICPLME